VEGKLDGTGYTTQNLKWDPNLKNSMPPGFPSWDITQMDPKTVMEYIMLSYQDKGSLKVH
jgi:hypothetical protein